MRNIFLVKCLNHVRNRNRNRAECCACLALQARADFMMIFTLGTSKHKCSSETRKPKEIPRWKSAAKPHAFLYHSDEYIKIDGKLFNWNKPKWGRNPKRWKCRSCRWLETAGNFLQSLKSKVTNEIYRPLNHLLVYTVRDQGDIGM